MRTHGFLLGQHQVLADDLGLHPQLDLATLPIFVLANLASGVTSVIPDVDLRRPGAIDPSRLTTHQIEKSGRPTAPRRARSSRSARVSLALHWWTARRDDADLHWRRACISTLLRSLGAIACGQCV